MNQGWIYQEQVDRRGAGMTLLDYYTQHYSHSSRVEWEARIGDGQVQLNGHVATAATSLQLGQHLAYHRPPWEEPPVPLEFEVLYEDEDLLAVAKPAGLPVMPGGGFLEHTLLWQVQQRFPDPVPVPLHRLGRGTSGLLLWARSPLARRTLSQLWRTATQHPTDPNPVLQKSYRALIGALHEADEWGDRTLLSTPIGAVPHPLLGTVYAASPHGKPAYSEVSVLRRAADQTLLEVTIRTGRPHQIRIHLAAAGYPLLGDPLYAPGGLPYPVSTAHPVVPGDCGYWLHAHRLALPHPRKGDRLHLCAPPPPELR